ncbi:hypothetical protein Nmel_010911 [Mimus melanotis]
MAGLQCQCLAFLESTQSLEKSRCSSPPLSLAGEHYCSTIVVKPTGSVRHGAAKTGGDGEKDDEPASAKKRKVESGEQAKKKKKKIAFEGLCIC